PASGQLNGPGRNLTPVLENEQQPPPAKPLPPEKWGAYAYYNNLGVELRSKGKLKEAADAFTQAMEIYPSSPIPYLNQAMVLADLQRFTDADNAFVQAVARGLPNAERYFVDFA